MDANVARPAKAGEVAKPTSSGEVAALIGSAAREGRPVVVRGAGTRDAWAPPLPKGHLLIDTTGLVEDPSLRPANLTAAFGAGVPLSQVQSRLTAEGLWLPVEHLGAPGATLGGCLAAGAVSPLRLAYGPLRDWVLGLEVVTPEGRAVRLGGETVKNVAGYDLVKLHLGAWGRLGLITRAIVRLLPAPEAEATVRASFPGVQRALSAAAELVVGRSRPMAVDLLWEEAQVQLFVRFGGQRATLPGRVSAAVESLGSTADVEVSADVDPEMWHAYGARWEALARHPWRARISVPVRRGAEALLAAAETLKDQDWAVAGQAGNGVFTFFWEGDPQAAGHLQKAIGPAGFVAAEGRSAAVLRENDWAGFPPRAPRAQDRLEAALLRAFDPLGIMNPHLPRPEGLLRPERGPEA